MELLYECIMYQQFPYVKSTQMTPQQKILGVSGTDARAHTNAHTQHKILSTYIDSFGEHIHV